MFNGDQPTTTTSSGFVSVRLSPPFSFKRITSIPEGYADPIRGAVIDFMAKSKMGEGINKQGFLYQTLQSMANAAVLGNGGEFWIGTHNDELVGYVLARIVNDIDGRLTYWISQAWARKDFRHSPRVKECWGALRQRAKDCLCSHLVIVAGRNPKAYKRFLGVHDYAQLLKLEI